MKQLIFVSGPCGCGKTTFTNLYAKKLAQQEQKPVYVIHGDDFQDGFVQPEGESAETVPWAEILRFNWDCLLAAAGRALRYGTVIVDYVVEDELPRVQQLAREHGAELFYLVLTADEEQLEQRLRQRGDVDLIERSLFLKRELESREENHGHLWDTTGKSPEELVSEMNLAHWRT